MEADRISEMLVPVYKLLRRLVSRIPQYFNCRKNFRFYKGMSQGKLPLITDRQYGRLMYLTPKYFVLLHVRNSCGTRPKGLTAHLLDVSYLKHVQLNSYPLILLVGIR